MKNKMRLYAAKIVGLGIAVGSAITAFAAKAALDSDVQDVASTTINTMKSNGVDLLKYAIPTVLVIFFVFFGWKFGLRLAKRFMH